CSTRETRPKPLPDSLDATGPTAAPHILRLTAQRRSPKAILAPLRWFKAPLEVSNSGDGLARAVLCSAQVGSCAASRGHAGPRGNPKERTVAFGKEWRCGSLAHGASKVAKGPGKVNRSEERR